MIDDAQWIVLLRAVSRLLGWIYTLSWSASFYPQPWLNWKLQSTRGFHIDFSLLNVLGFACYTASTCSFYYSPTIRSQYAARHPTSPEPTVRFNDVAFGVHALILVIMTYSQFFPWVWGFSDTSSQRASRLVQGIVWGSLIAVGAVFIVVLCRSGWTQQDAQDWAWIDVLYTLGYVKLICTFVKYIPQAIFNFKRKSTEGWSILQIMFDITGGTLSLLQLVIDSSLQGDWSGITGNSLKLGILYRGQDDLLTDADDSSERPLLDH